MKKIYKSLLLAMVAAMPMLFASCSDDNDSNPILTIPSSFVLNTPGFAANNVYDLPKGDMVLTTSQPDYGGFPAAVTYAVQLSLDPTADDNWKEMATTYTNARMTISGKELNNTVLDMYHAANGDDDPTTALPLYIRLRAFLADTDPTFAEVFSNTITVNVLSYNPPVEAGAEVELPTSIYVCGNSIDQAWSTWKFCPAVCQKPGRFYTMIYNNADGFKWGNKENDWFGYDKIDEFDDQAGAGIGVDGDGNITFSNPGWYVLEFIAKVVSNELKYTLIVAPGKAGVIGNAVDNGSWSPAYMTAPAAKGDFTFDAWSGTGELRAFIEVPGEDWWRTEFTVYGGAIFWRDAEHEVNSNWNDDVGAEYSVQAAPGHTLKVNFDTYSASYE
jgi:hypothetical protein